VDGKQDRTHEEDSYVSPETRPTARRGLLFSDDEDGMTGDGARRAANDVSSRTSSTSAGEPGSEDKHESDDKTGRASSAEVGQEGREVTCSNKDEEENSELNDEEERNSERERCGNDGEEQNLESEHGDGMTEEAVGEDPVEMMLEFFDIADSDEEGDSDAGMDLEEMFDWNFKRDMQEAPPATDATKESSEDQPVVGGHRKGAKWEAIGRLMREHKSLQERFRNLQQESDETAAGLRGEADALRFSLEAVRRHMARIVDERDTLEKEQQESLLHLADLRTALVERDIIIEELRSGTTKPA